MNKQKLLFALAMLIFGSIGLFVRTLPFTSSQIALARGLIGSAFLFVSSFILKKGLSLRRIRNNLKVLLPLGIMLGFNWILLFQAYRYTSIANATVSYYCAPVIVMLLTPVVFKEPLTRTNVLCIFAAMAGMVCISGAGGALDRQNLIGIAYGFGGAVFYAAIVLTNKFLKDISDFESAFTQLFVAALALLPYVLLTDGVSLAGASAGGVLLLFLVGAGVQGGAGFVETLRSEGGMLFVYGAVMTLIPMLVGYVVAAKLLKLSLFNNLGSITGGMTSTPALGTLIDVAGTDDVASAYAATYPIALVSVVLSSQFIVLLMR